MPTTATAMAEAQTNRALQFALVRLFEKLRHFVRVYPIREEDKVPEHDIVWVTDIGRGPELAILDAIKANPELWANALPAECCIVPRKTLAKLLSDDAVEALAMEGAYLVDTQAARYEAEAEEASRRLKQERP